MRLAICLLTPLVLLACGDEVCPAGTVDFGEGCTPTDAAVDSGDASPDACVSTPEECNGLDDDCDGTADEGLPETTYYLDSDEDTYGDDASAVMACVAPPMHVEVGGDCADSDENIYPGADEVCDGADQDCDVAIDEGLLVLDDSEVVVGDGPTSFLNGAVDIAGYEAGYVLVYLDDTQHLRMVTTNSVGTPASSAVRVDPGGPVQFNPTVDIVGTAGASRAIVLWGQGSALRARVFPLDGTMPTPAVDIATAGSSNFRAQVVSLGDDVLLVWDEYDSASRILARAFDPMTGTPRGTTTEVFAHADIPIAYSARVGAAAVDGPEAFALVAIFEQRAGDLHEVLYLKRAWVEAGEVEQDSEPFRFAGPDARDLLEPRPVASNDGAIEVLYAEDDASSPAVYSQAMDAASRTAAMSTSGDPVDLMAEGLPIDQARVPGGALVLSVSFATSETQLLWHGMSEGTGDDVISVYLPPSGRFVVGPSVSAMSPNEAAVLYTRETMGSTYEHIFQRIACE